jgi:hypothetical protein
MTQNEKKVVAEKWLFDGREKYFPGVFSYF